MKQAQLIISCIDLTAEVAFFSALGFKLLQVFPADDPRMMVMAFDGMTLKLEKQVSTDERTHASEADNHGTTLLLNGESGDNPQISPNGVVVKFHSNTDVKPKFVWPERIDFAVNQFNAAESWVTGRAGMLYRDLIPSRLGGAIIASNIMIADGGPVPDHVHYHSIQFQLIFCVKGWVKVVYEDQGEPFVLLAGDCVTQPPGIRHQVLESSDGLEVLEIGLPAEHMTSLDYALQLPTERHLPERWFGESTANQQKFCHHQQVNAQWHPMAEAAFKSCQTEVETASGGIAAVNVYNSSHHKQAHVAQSMKIQHSDALRFYYLMAGEVTINTSGINKEILKTRDSWVLPAGQCLEFIDRSTDFQCIEFVLR